MKRILTATLLAITFGCSGASHEILNSEADSGSGSGSETTASVDAFEVTLFPVVQTQCASCHGASQSPLFAVSDVDSAHSTISSYIDLDDPGNSSLVLKIAGGHQSFATSLADDLQDEIENWVLAME